MSESNVLASGQSSKTESSAKLSKQAYEFLLDELLTSRFQPGDILVEEDLARKLGTSRTPVREALRTLVAEGFLRVIPRSGYMVVLLTPQDVREIYHMRLLLEGEAAALAAERITDEGTQEILRELESVCKEIERQSPEGRKLSEATHLLDHNTHFHLAIARASGNGRLTDALSQLLQEAKRMRSYYEGAEYTFVAREHLAILEEIRSGDPERARLAMRQHIEMGRSAIFRWFGSTD